MPNPLPHFLDLNEAEWSEDRESAGRAAYEEDVRRQPRYFTGEPRPRWEALCSAVQENWRRYPSARVWPSSVSLDREDRT